MLRGPAASVIKSVAPPARARGYVEAVDGSPSAPDSRPESLELTEGSPRPSDTERELDELRARAYGPEADIEGDPAAMARLVELEAAHLSAVTAVRAGGSAAVAAPVPAATPADPAGGITPATARRGPGRGGAIAGAIVLVVVVLAVAAWNLVPRPDATLKQIEVEANSDIIRVLSAQGRGPVPSTLRRFEPYHDVRVWSVEDHAGKVCFIVWDLAVSGRFSITCAPPGTEVALTLSVASEGDEFGRWLLDGSEVVFRFREDTVDVFVRPPDR
ncbi:hypothetical protein RS82_00445 [Microbacterium trichothecenolyticum]|uniref:Uncharacterized protein n=1 Tax=Microbacterium trichothecenolyticum TaxID=69370 RepID=A0A0M2HL24_MICTR|nr:hypothetical protein RS82_00445 [Microbacterium trichothecenolyticum]